MPKYDFLESETTLMKEAKAAGEYAARMKTSNRVFVIWRDLAKLFEINNGQRYHKVHTRVRKTFMRAYNTAKLKLKESHESSEQAK